MSVRFEILLNGQRLCIAGAPGSGVLSFGVTRVQHEDEPEELRMHAGGLGRYHPELSTDCHVNWMMPDHLSVGDEVTVRVLPAGDYDDPVNVRRSPSAETNDPDFGTLRFNISAWDGRMPFEFQPARTAELQLRLDGSVDGPSSTQRELFKQLKSRYAELWPSISESLCRCHRVLKSVAEVNQHLDPTVCLSISNTTTNELELVYTFDMDSDHSSYFVALRDWQVVAIGRME